jgi:hypothetical protein
MKIVSVLFAALLLGFSSKAQNSLSLPGSVTGFFNNASATNNWYYTPAITTPIVASSCTSAKTIAGAFTNGTSPNADIRFNAYTIDNLGTSTVCVALTLDPACSSSGTTLLLTVFKGTFAYNGALDRAAFQANYIGDAGAYSSGTTSCSVPVAAGQSILVVVGTNGSNRACSSYTLTAAAVAPAPLPVDLVSFKGRATPAGTALEWATASEQGNLGFVVERSADGQSFTPLGRVAGGGTRTQASTYAYLDATPLPLGYYRLRQQDVGGAEHFSPVVSVQASGELSFFPNPVLDRATFTSPAATRLTVRDGLGRVCRVLPLAAGSQPVSLATLPAGVYSVTNEATHQTMRLVKANQQ